jgi:hypothetical protein
MSSDGNCALARSRLAAASLLRWFGFLRYPPIGTEIVLYTDRLKELRSALESSGYGPGEIKLQPRGDLDFRVSDCDGQTIRVSEGSSIPLLE